MENKHIQNIGYEVAIKNLKQKLKATSHGNRINQYKKKPIVSAQPKIFYQQLKSKEIEQKPP